MFAIVSAFTIFSSFFLLFSLVQRDIATGQFTGVIRRCVHLQQHGTQMRKDGEPETCPVRCSDQCFVPTFSRIVCRHSCLSHVEGGYTSQCVR